MLEQRDFIESDMYEKARAVTGKSALSEALHIKENQPESILVGIKEPFSSDNGETHAVETSTDDETKKFILPQAKIVSNTATEDLNPLNIDESSDSKDRLKTAFDERLSSKRIRPAFPNTTLVQLTPLTGRTHQLRVHMAHMGFPILGDTLYAPPNIQSQASRLCLHAQSITFKHPLTMQVVTISSTAACDFIT